MLRVKSASQITESNLKGKCLWVTCEGEYITAYLPVKHSPAEPVTKPTIYVEISVGGSKKQIAGYLTLSELKQSVKLVMTSIAFKDDDYKYYIGYQTPF